MSNSIAPNLNQSIKNYPIFSCRIEPHVSSSLVQIRINTGLPSRVNVLPLNRIHPYPLLINTISKKKAFLESINNSNWEKTTELLTPQFARLKGVLHLVIEKGNMDLAELFLQKGADPQGNDHKKNTPLHTAAKHGHLNFIKLLISDYSANINVENSEGFTPLHYASFYGHLEVVETLLKNAGIEVHYDIYLKNSLYADRQTKKGSTSLHLAAQNGHHSIVKLLISHLVNANAQDEEGFTPLHFAATNGFFENAKTLILYGAEIDAKTQNNSTPLHFATSNDHQEIVNLLLVHGANPNIKNSLEISPFHSAVKKNTPNIVSLFLLSSKILVNQKNIGGQTALHIAAYYGYADTIRSLLDNPFIDINPINDERNTPLHFAVDQNRLGIAKMLIMNKADYEMKNKKGMTPLKMLFKKLGAKKVRNFLTMQ